MTAVEWPEVTAAVCVRNGADTIRTCLESLEALEYPSGKLNILVVDNGSEDETVSIVESMGVPVIREPRIGRGYARNRAWHVCASPFLAFTDADCRVSPDWLTRIMPVFADETVGEAGGIIVTPGDSPLARFFQARRIVSNAEFSGNYPFSPPFLATANAVFRKTAMDAVNGFDAEMTVGEDADISWRMADAGYAIRFIPGGTVYHHHRTTVAGMFRQSRDYGFGGVMVCVRHRRRFPPPPWIWWGLYARFLGSLCRLPVFFLAPRGRKRFALYDAIRYGGLILGRLRAAVHFRIAVL